MTATTDNSAKLFIFQHIPKTAGSTMHTLLDKRFDNRLGIFASSHDDEEALRLRNLPEAERQAIDVLKGHMPFGLHRYMPRPAQYFTILRDPVKRIISQYFYIKKNVNNPLHDRLVSDDMSPGQLVESGISVGLNNGHIRWLLGDLKAEPFGAIGPKHLQQAIDNLEQHFITVGVNEMFDQSILVLADKLGWEKPPYYDRMNTNRKKSTVTDTDIEIIKQYNEFDIQLYDYAVKRLQTEMDAIPDFEQKLATFQKINQRYSTLKKPLRFLRLIK